MTEDLRATWPFDDAKPITAKEILQRRAAVNLVPTGEIVMLAIRAIELGNSDVAIALVKAIGRDIQSDRVTK